jgi:hypothetical protein
MSGRPGRARRSHIVGTRGPLELVILVQVPLKRATQVFGRRLGQALATAHEPIVIVVLEVALELAKHGGRVYRRRHFRQRTGRSAP